MKAEDLKVKDVILIYGVSGMAFTSKSELVVKQVMPERNYIHFVNKGKRKLYGYNLDKLSNNDLVFLNQTPPFVRDIDAKAKSDGSGSLVSTFHGNALINLVGEITPSEVREYIEINNKNPLLDKSLITYNEKLLYPKIPCFHAVVVRMKKNEEVWS